MESYATIRAQLQTGDLLFFHGGDFVSSTIGKIEKRVAGNGDYTHVGLVVLSSAFPVGHPYHNPTTIEPYTFESTQSGWLTDGVLNLLGNSFLGVQLRRLDSVVEYYLTNASTKISWGPLQASWRATLDPQRVLDLIRHYDGTRYELSMLDLLAATYPCLRKWRALRLKLCCTTAARWLFCSELVAHVLQDLNILPENVICENVLPVHLVPPAFLGNKIVSAIVPIAKTNWTGGPLSSWV